MVFHELSCANPDIFLRDSLNSQCLFKMEGPSYVPGLVILVELNQHLLQSTSKSTCFTLCRTQRMLLLYSPSQHQHIINQRLQFTAAIVLVLLDLLLEK